MESMKTVVLGNYRTKLLTRPDTYLSERPLALSHTTGLGLLGIPSARIIIVALRLMDSADLSRLT